MKRRKSETSKPAWIKQSDTKETEQRDAIMRVVPSLGRRDFMKVTTSVAGVLAANGLVHPHSFLPVSVASAAEGGGGAGGVEPFRFAYISDSHLYERKLNDRFLRSLIRAVDDVNALDPQPDFVLYGGDLAQLGQASELDLGAQMLRELKAPVRMMVGEHDWYLDMGEKWRELFGQPTYSFDHKGVHFVTLNSVVEKDFWTAKGMSPKERMGTVAGLDNGAQSSFTVGDVQRKWLEADLAPLSNDTPLIVFSHSPLYKYYKKWNFWTDDADEVQALLRRFDHVVVLHGHTHQQLTHRIGNIHFHGMLSTAWPWPYAPQGLPELTVQMNRPDPFNPLDGCGRGFAQVHPDGLIDKMNQYWNRNPVNVTRRYLNSWGSEDRPPHASRSSY